MAGYGVLSFLTIRFLIGALCVGAFGWRKVRSQAIVPGIAIGVALALGYLFQTLGLRSTTPTNSGLITSLFVVVVPLGNRILYGHRTSSRLWIATVVSVVGLVLLTGTGSSPLTFGDLITLGAAVSFGMHIVLLGHFARHHDTVGLCVVQLAAATVLFAVAWPLAEPFSWPGTTVWPALLLTGVVATAAGFYIQTLAQRHLSPTKAAIIFTMEAVFAMFFGYLLAGDRLTAMQFAGAALMIAAVGFAEIGPAYLAHRRASREGHT